MRYQLVQQERDTFAMIHIFVNIHVDTVHLLPNSFPPSHFYRVFHLCFSRGGSRRMNHKLGQQGRDPCAMIPILII